MSDIRAKALIMVVSRPEAVDIAVEKIGPEVLRREIYRRVSSLLASYRAQPQERTAAP